MTDIVKSDAIPDKIPASRALHTNLLKGCMLVCVSLTLLWLVS